MVAFTTIFLCLTVLRTSISEEYKNGTAIPYFQKSIYNFTLNLVQRMKEETHNNFVTSAVSPWTLLLVMSLGGNVATREQIWSVLQLHTDKCSVHVYLELVNQVTMKPDHPTSSMLKRSSTIFFNASENTNQRFFDDLSKAGIYNSRIMYFVDHNETAQSINDHVKSFTDQNIMKVVKPDDLKGISTLTIDALTFNGIWKVSFPYEDTETGLFYDEQGEPIGDVFLMNLCAPYNVISLPQIRGQVLELPYYGDDSSYSMLIFLPEHKVTLKTMLDLMMDINISTIYNLYEQSGPTKITVQIPRFKISSSFGNWNELLISMGLNAIFENKESRVTDIYYYQLFLTNYLQKAELELNEKGMKIGRATATLMQSRFLYDDFVANKPFLFMVVDRIHHVPILTGAYSKPSFYKQN